MDSGLVSVYQISAQLPNWNLISGEGLVKEKRLLRRSSQRGSGPQMLQRNPKVAGISECFAVSKSEHGDLEDQCGEWQTLGGSSSAHYSWHQNLPNLLFFFIYFFFKKREKPGESKHISPHNVCFTFSRRPWFDLVFFSTARNLKQMNQMHTPCWWKPKHWSDLQSTETQFKCFLS